LPSGLSVFGAKHALYHIIFRQKAKYPFFSLTDPGRGGQSGHVCPSPASVICSRQYTAIVFDVR